MAGEQNRDRWRRYWDQTSPSYDKQMRFYERVLLGDSRSWVCGQAIGDTLEIAVGTGRNLPFYPAGVELTGIDFSPAMLEIARQRAAELRIEADLREGDTQALEFEDASFDTVVITLALCSIPDDHKAVAEARR